MFLWTQKFRVWAFELKDWALGCMVWGLRFEGFQSFLVPSLEFKVQGANTKGSCLGVLRQIGGP